MCGEYREDFSGPHYHAIIFGFDFPDKYHFRTDNGNKLYRSPLLERLWPYGFSTIGAATFQTAAYTARYICKKVNGDAARDHYSAVDPGTGEIGYRTPEYVAMSRGRAPDGGIGKRWFDKYKADLDKDFIHVNGRRMRPVRYYDVLQERTDPDRYEQIKEQRGEAARVRDRTHETPQRRQVRETLLLRRADKLKRGLKDENENV